MDKQLIKNIVSLFGVQGMNYLIPLITLPYLVKTLGPESYGVLGFSLSLVQYFCLLTDYGFNLSATREIAIYRDNKPKTSEIFWSVTACKLILMLIGALILYVLFKVSDYIALQQKVILAAYGLTLGNVLFPVWLFQGKEKMALSSIANICARFFSVPLTFMFVTSPNDAWIAALINSATAIVGGILSICFLYKERYVSIRRISLYHVFEQIKSGWHVFLSTAAVSLYSTSITVILGFVCGSTVVGYFVAADKLRQAAQGLLVPISQAIYPKLSAVMTNDPANGFRMLRKILRYYSLSGLLLSIILMFSAKFIVELVYGQSFSHSVSVLLWLGLCPFLVAVSNILGIQTLLVLGYHKQFSRILMISGLINMLVLFPLTYSLSENGAAIAILLTELVVVIFMVICVIKNKIPLFK